MKNNDLVIGVLGGMGTYATINLFNEYAHIFKAKKEWERPRIIIDNRCTMPSRVRAFLYHENVDQLIEEMCESIKYLEYAGCTKIILGCMTSHLFLPKIYNKIPNIDGKIINLIDNCAKIISKDNINEVYLLGSEGTIESKVFQNALKKYNIKCFSPTREDYQVIRECIEAVKQNEYSHKIKDNFLSLINQSKCIILGCTELPILYQKYRKWIKCPKVYDPLALGLEKLKKEFNDD